MDYNDFWIIIGNVTWKLFKRLKVFCCLFVFSVGVVVPKHWDYIRVPVQVNVESELNSLNRLETILAPWKFCDETKENPDSEADTIDSIIKQIQVAKCENLELLISSTFWNRYLRNDLCKEYI